MLKLLRKRSVARCRRVFTVPGSMHSAAAVSSTLICYRELLCLGVRPGPPEKGSRRIAMEAGMLDAWARRGSALPGADSTDRV